MTQICFKENVTQMYNTTGKGGVDFFCNMFINVFLPKKLIGRSAKYCIQVSNINICMLEFARHHDFKH